MWNTLAHASRPLVGTALLMFVALVGFTAGLILDPTIIAGAPAWLKPAKFATSIAIYCLTLAWIFTWLPDRVRLRRSIGWITAVALTLEMVIIGLQAWRGTTSHFNLATPFDAILFQVMGLVIVAQTFTTIAVAVALWRQRFSDRALGWALRLGMTITIVGAFSGGLMARPTSEQLSAAAGGAAMTTIGAHTVGAPDGGPGLPGTGWSTTHGDLRIAHFAGLHALQILPLIAVGLRRRSLSERVRERLTLTAAGSYAGLFLLLLSQALRGQSILAPDVVTVALLASWVVITAIAARWSFVESASVAPHVSGATRRRLRESRHLIKSSRSPIRWLVSRGCCSWYCRAGRG